MAGNEDIRKRSEDFQFSREMNSDQPFGSSGFGVTRQLQRRGPWMRKKAGEGQKKTEKTKFAFLRNCDLLFLALTGNLQKG